MKKCTSCGEKLGNDWSLATVHVDPESDVSCGGKLVDLCDTPAMPTVEQLTERIKAEILEAVAAGNFPNTACRWQLQVYCDAYCFGVDDALCEEFGIDAATPIVDAARDAVSAWLACGALAEAK